MSKKDLIQVLPDSIVFREIAVGDNDFADIYISNIGTSTVRVRCSISNRSPFILSTEGTLTLPPGLETKVSLTYDAKDERIYTADLFVETQSQKITIPVKAIPPSAHITTETTLINLRQINVDDENKFMFPILNNGMKEGTFNITCDEDNVKILPKSGTLSPNQTQEINCTYKSINPGDFSFSINIHSDESIEKCKPIDVKGKSIKTQVSLLFDGKPAHEFDFGTIYYHQRQVIKTTIVNNGSTTRSFVVFPANDQPGTSKSSLSQGHLHSEEDQTFVAYPSEGLLEPYKSQTINFVFQPLPSNQQVIDDIENIFCQFSSIEIVESGQKIDLQFNGKAIFHQVSLSSIDFSFGKHKIDTKTSQALTITNKSHFKPTSFSFENVAHFRFNPEKGEIQPGKSKEVTITFYPRNLGVFELTTKILYFGGLFHTNLNFNAECCDPDAKPFKRIPIYETDDNAKFEVMHPDKRYAYGMDEIAENTLKRQTFDSYITEQAERRAILTEKNEFLEKTIREAKSQLTKTGASFTEDDVNEIVQQKLLERENNYDVDNEYGLVHCDGLKPPDPPIKRKAASPLFLLHPEKFGVISSNKRSQTSFQTRRKLFPDDNVSNKKKFKGKPTTPQEINECSRTLTPAQQLMVNASHQTMNFGSVSVFTLNTKSFCIVNNLQQYIIASLQIDAEELSQTTPLSQVIPPHSTASFDVKFYSKKQTNFVQTVHYSINGKPANTFTVTAQALPIDLHLSRSAIEFRFAPDSSAPVIKEFVLITNKSIGVAQYNWTGMNEYFSLAPTSGSIEPKKMQTFEITYTPTTHPHDEATLVVNVVGGASKSLRCIGDVGAPKLSLPKKTVVFGLIPIGITKTQFLKIKNVSDDDALFTIAHNDLSEISVMPESGKITARDSLNLQINIKALQDHRIEVPITIAVAGTHPISFTVTGQAEFPSVHIQNKSFDFGKLFVGSSAKLEALLFNDGQIPAVLYLDLSAHPEFHIEYPPELTENGEHVNNISLVSDPIFVTKSEMKSLSQVSSKKSVSKFSSMNDFGASELMNDELDDSSNDDDDNSKGGIVYKIQIIEKSSIAFNFVYQPTHIAEHSFELPCTMMNVLSSTSFHLQPIVSAEAIRAPISISDSSINFGVAPIFDSTNPHSRPIVRQVWFRNDHKTQVKWRFDTSQPFLSNPAIFTVEPSAGTIEFAQSKSVHISFTPNESTPYSTYLHVYTTIDDQEECMIGQIQLTGVGTKMLYRMSHNNVCLPIVPLNVKSQVSLFVLNEGFIETELKLKMAVDENHFPIKITFPEGPKLEHTKDKIPVNVSFSSSKPMCFSTIIALIDDFGGATTFEVTCTADNSMFTLYPFLSNKELIVKTGGGKPITFEHRGAYTKQSELMSRFINAADVKDLKNEVPKNWTPTCSELMIQFIQRYLNAIVMTSQISSFPKNIIQNDFQLIHEAISNLTSGKKVPGDGDRNNSTKDPLTRRKENVSRVIKFLESYGALLSCVKPEFLLSKNDFLQIMKAKITKQLLGLDYFDSPDASTLEQPILSAFTSSKSFSDALLERTKILEDLYDSLSTESWMFVIMQMLKIFTLNKITIERFSKTPGVSESIKAVQVLAERFSGVDDYLTEINRSNKNILNSNIFSPSEGVLLKWLSLNYCNITNELDHTAVTTFESLNDGLALSALIKAYTTAVRISLNNNPTDRASRLNNAIEFTSSLKDLKLGFNPRSNEIVDGNAVMLALTCAYLFENITFYLPQSQLVFATSLHKTLTKNVTISNKSNAEIKYTAVLDASPNYTITNDSILIGPNQTIDFPIFFSARTIQPSAGRLTLTPSRPRLVSASTNNTKPQTAEGSKTGTPYETSRRSQMPIFSAPVVVDMISDVTLTKPDGTYEIDGPIYETTKLTIPVKNFIGVPSKVRLIPRISQLVNANGTKVKQTKTLQEQMIDLINNPSEEPEKMSEKTSQFDNYIQSHQMFLFNEKFIEFPHADSEFELEVEFVPIVLGEFRCLLLFQDDKYGEFILEILAKSHLPDVTEVANNKFKVEANKSCNYSIPIDLINPHLITALAYSIEKSQNQGLGVSDRKLKDLLTRRQRECESLFRQAFDSQKFTISNSSTFFTVPSECIIQKQQPVQASRDAKEPINCIPTTFKPTKAGDYPCKLLLMSKYDIRLLLFKGIGLASTKTMDVNFSTVVGRPMKQEIPLQNPSDNVWNFKINLTGDNQYSSPGKLSVKPKTTGALNVTFTPHRIGTFYGELSIYNINKESTTIYKLSASVDEPPAEEKIVIDCQARQMISKTLVVKSSIIKNANVQVTTTVPIISFNPEISFADGEQAHKFDYQIYAPRSGISAGTLTFTDPATRNYIWYVFEIHVDSPDPEQTIEVSTEARKSSTVKIPIANSKSTPTQFQVILSDDDLFGEKSFVAAPNATTDYVLIVSPLKEMKRASSVYFYSDDGEFWYSLIIESYEPQANTLAPLTSALGKFASAFIELENPLTKAVTFRTENDNPTAFHIVAKRLIQLAPHEKKRVEIRYIPTTVGTKECASIQFQSNDLGDWTYRLTGTGKPPQPLSPTIVTTSLNSTASALVLFSNPFPYPCRFSVSMGASTASDGTESGEQFKFLAKRKVFTLSLFGEEYQIPFAFNPSSLGQFQTNIVVASLGSVRGPLPTLDDNSIIRFVFPIIGNSLLQEGREIRFLRCKSQESLETELKFPLVGEKDVFQASDYVLSAKYPTGYEFINLILDMKPKQITRIGNNTEITVSVRLTPRRPFQLLVPLTFKNPLGQEWQFEIDIKVDRGKVTANIQIESLLNKTGEATISVPEVFREQTLFHTYFVNGSAGEFTVTPDHGFIPPSFAITESWTELPITVVFAPKMYGKILKGLLVVDTLNSQFLFEIEGKTPEYVPPVIQSGSSKSRLDNFIKQEDIQLMKPKRNKKKIIKENIEFVKRPKITSPHIARK